PNSSGVNDPKLTEMIGLQRRTLDAAKRRDIIWDIQRYLAEQVYYLYGPSARVVAAWAPHVRNFTPLRPCRRRGGAPRAELRAQPWQRLRGPSHGGVARPMSLPAR